MAQPKAGDEAVTPLPGPDSLGEDLSFTASRAHTASQVAAALGLGSLCSPGPIAYQNPDHHGYPPCHRPSSHLSLLAAEQSKRKPSPRTLGSTSKGGLYPSTPKS